MTLKKENKKTPAVAAALRYHPDKDQAPVIVAGGKGRVADFIKEVATENDIPIYKDENLAQALVQLGVGAQIPEELYEVVAEILIFVAKIDKRYKL